MLLRFSVSNYLSIAARQEISLVATKLKGPSSPLLRSSAIGQLNALSSAVIYGANASGKTNFIKAIEFMRSAILFSHRQGKPEGGVPRLPYQLDSQIRSSPTMVEADFVLKDIRYQYGFECDDDQFVSEWLYTFPEGKRRRLFERTKNEVEFGQSLKGPKKILVSLMRPNSLFISTATQNDHEDLSRIVSFFQSMQFSSTISVAKNLINNTFKKGEIHTRTISFLKEIGTGIVNYRQTEIQVPDNIISFQKEIMEIARKHMGEVSNRDEDTDREKDISIELAHIGSDGSEVFFGLERESSGTRRLILILNSIFKALDEGTVVFVDELDASLHTLAVEQILTLFNDTNINQNGAQLIATTHDTNLLACKSLRRDQIWFAEKSGAGETNIFPLSDIKSRISDNFEQGYLEGRYGGIPYSGDLRILMNGAVV
jgi:AAA15 family ATPase/GTPase